MITTVGNYKLAVSEISYRISEKKDVKIKIARRRKSVATTIRTSKPKGRSTI